MEMRKAPRGFPWDEWFSNSLDIIYTLCTAGNSCSTVFIFTVKTNPKTAPSVWLLRKCLPVPHPQCRFHISARFPAETHQTPEHLKLVSLSAACRLDHPVLLLPDFWLCSEHPGGRQHRGLPKHHSGLPAAAGEEARLVFLSVKDVWLLSCVMCQLWLTGVPVISNDLSAVNVLLTRVQPDNFPYKEEIGALSHVSLVLVVLLFIGCILSFKVLLSTEALLLSVRLLATWFVRRITQKNCRADFQLLVSPAGILEVLELKEMTVF